MWSNRAEKHVDLRVADGRTAEWLGLDEGGAGLLKLDGEAVAVTLADSAQLFAVPDLQDSLHQERRNETGPHNPL